jgi:hypothetical protein
MTTAKAPQLLTSFQARTLETTAATVELNRHVAEQVTQVGTLALRESARAWCDLQAAALEAARQAQEVASAPAETGLRQDPMAWYMGAAAETTQQGAKLLETQAQILVKSGERVQAASQEAGKQIQQALTHWITRLRDLQTTS